MALEHYRRTADGYVLAPQYDEFSLEDRIWLLPEVDTDQSVSSTAVDELIAGVKEAGLAADRAALEAAVDGFLADHALSAQSVSEVTAHRRRSSGSAR